MRLAPAVRRLGASPLCLLTALLSLPLLTSGCSEDTVLGSVLNRPDLKVVEREQIQGTTGAAVRTVVKNQGDGTAYGTTVELRLKDGNTVIETAHGVAGRVESGQRVQEEVPFFDVDRHDEYSSTRCSLTWIDARDQTHSAPC